MYLRTSRFACTSLIRRHSRRESYHAGLDVYDDARSRSSRLLDGSGSRVRPSDSRSKRRPSPPHGAAGGGGGSGSQSWPGTFVAPSSDRTHHVVGSSPWISRRACPNRAGRVRDSDRRPESAVAPLLVSRGFRIVIACSEPQAQARSAASAGCKIKRRVDQRPTLRETKQQMAHSSADYAG